MSHFNGRNVKSYCMQYVLCMCICAYNILTPNTTHIILSRFLLVNWEGRVRGIQ